MKKTAFLITLLTLIFSLTICAHAASDTYYIEEQGMQITIPSDYYVFTRDISDSDPALDYLGLSKTEVVKLLEEEGAYLAAFSSDGKRIISIEVKDEGKGIDDYALCEDALILMLLFAVIGGVNVAAVVVIIVVVNRKRAQKADNRTDGIASVPLTPIAPEDILHCRNCGLRMLPDSIYCQRCGTRVKKEE